MGYKGCPKSRQICETGRRIGRFADRRHPALDGRTGGVGGGDGGVGRGRQPDNRCATGATKSLFVFAFFVHIQL